MYVGAFPCLFFREMIVTEAYYAFNDTFSKKGTGFPVGMSCQKEATRNLVFVQLASLFKWLHKFYLSIFMGHGPHW